MVVQSAWRELEIRSLSWKYRLRAFSNKKSTASRSWLFVSMGIFTYILPLTYILWKKKPFYFHQGLLVDPIFQLHWENNKIIILYYNHCPRDKKKKRVQTILFSLTKVCAGEKSFSLSLSHPISKEIRQKESIASLKAQLSEVQSPYKYLRRVKALFPIHIEASLSLIQLNSSIYYKQIRKIKDLFYQNI